VAISGGGCVRVVSSDEFGSEQGQVALVTVDVEAVLPSNNHRGIGGLGDTIRLPFVSTEAVWIDDDDIKDGDDGADGVENDVGVEMVCCRITK